MGDIGYTHGDYKQTNGDICQYMYGPGTNPWIKYTVLSNRYKPMNQNNWQEWKSIEHA